MPKHPGPRSVNRSIHVPEGGEWHWHVVARGPIRHFFVTPEIAASMSHPAYRG
jgi:hypothetical protein